MSWLEHKVVSVSGETLEVATRRMTDALHKAQDENYYPYGELQISLDKNGKIIMAHVMVYRR